MNNYTLPYNSNLADLDDTITFDYVNGKTEAHNLKLGKQIKIKVMSFDSNLTDGVDITFRQFCYIVLGRGGTANSVLCDAYNGISYLNTKDSNIDITCANKTANIKIKNASYRFGFAIYY